MSQPFNPNGAGGQRDGGSGRTIQELEADLMAMWSLVNELGEQLSSNRALAESLKSRASDVKGQAVHTGTGFPLRRYNVDISDEQFTTELEKFASHLVLENQNLQYENKQLSLLLKECEGTLEGVMARFRSVSHAATQHELALHSYYTSIIAQLQSSHSSATLLDSTNLSTLLTRLSELIRAALRSVNGEDTTREDEELLPPDIRDAVGGSNSDSGLSNGLRGMLAELEDAGKSLQDAAQRKEQIEELTLERDLPLSSRAKYGDAPDMSPSSGSTGSGQSLLMTPRSAGLPTRDRSSHRTSGMPSTIGRWLGDAGTSGGYHGTEGREDWALEREGEITRLEEENQMLRKLLGVDLEMIGDGGDTAEETEEDKAAVAAAREEGRRQSEEIQAMRVTSSFMENSGLSVPEHASPSAPRRTFAQSTADIVPDLRMSSISERPHKLGTSPKSSTMLTSDKEDWRDDLTFTNPEKQPSPEKVSAIGSTAHLEDVPLEDVVFTSPEEDQGPGAAARSPPRARSPIKMTSPKFTAPPSPMMATSPTFSRTQTMPSLSKSPKASTSRVSMLSPTHSKTSLPSLASPQSSASLRGSTGIEGGLGSPNPLASIFVKPKTDATTATTTSADPALEMGEISVAKDSSGSPMASRSMSTPASGSPSSLGLGFSSIPSPLGSPVAAAGAQEIRRTLSSPGAVPTLSERKTTAAGSEGSEVKVEHLEEP